MAELKRRRNQNASPTGLADAGDVADRAVAQHLAALAENVERLFRMVAALQQQPAGAPAAVVKPDNPMRLEEGQNIRITRRGNRYLISSTAAGGGGDFAIEEVDAFPAIPDTPQIIYHTGDDTLWWAGPGLTRWQPMGWTDLTGVPA